MNFKILYSEDIKELRIIKEISSGASGKVLEVGKEEKLALKMMHTGEFTVKDFKGFAKEYEILCMLKHPNIVQTFGIFLSDESTPPSILLELCSQNLNTAIKKSNPTQIDIITWVYQIVEGMKYVHEYNIIHRDLKPTNILIGKDNLIRISDFGISKLMTSEEQSTTLGVGTQKFMAPEILKEEEYNEKADVYSFGVVLYFMLNEGEMPKINIIQVGNGKKAKIPSNFSSLAKELIDSCWNYEPKDRPSFEEILSLLEKNDYKLFELKKSEIKEIRNFVQNHQKLISQIKASKEIPKKLTKRSNISPPFIKVVDQFKENKIFAFLCSLIIQNANNLITDPQSNLLNKHFCYQSDLVTILETLYDINVNKSEEGCESVFNILTIHSIYSQIEDEFEVKNGRKMVNQSIEWAMKQKDKIYGAVDKFVSLLDTEKFEFKYIVNANTESVPSLVYKTKDNKEIKVFRRPGCHCLQSPGNVVILSIIEATNHGMIIHKPKNLTESNPGVAGVEIYNNLFFFKLFEVSMVDVLDEDKLIRIYRTQKPNKNMSFLFYINNIYDKSFISYCPRDKSYDKDVIVPLFGSINSLMPYVPRSILLRMEDFKCTFEINGYGSLNHFSTLVHMDFNEKENPIPYPINNKTLKYALSNINQLEKDEPKVRFALTGECFSFDKSNKNCFDDYLFYPDVSPSIESVFDPCHPSHLVLLVDQGCKNKPSVSPLSWTYKEHLEIKNQMKKIIWNYNEASIPLFESDGSDDNRTTCMYICTHPNSCYSAPFFVYEENGSINPKVICKGCMIEFFKNMEGFQSVINPKTKKIDFQKMNKLHKMLPGLPLGDDSSKSGGETWPQIPLGLALYTIMFESGEIPVYTKSWLTAIANFCVLLKSSDVIRCPNHPSTMSLNLKRPKDGINLKCPYCDMFLCASCKCWHKLSEKCSYELEGIKRCPYCKAPTVKICGSNQMHCRCGKHWCYKCDSNSTYYNTAGECYNHLYTIHGGYFT